MHLVIIDLGPPPRKKDKGGWRIKQMEMRVLDESGCHLVGIGMRRKEG